MAIDLLPILREIANAAISRNATKDFVADRMVNLLREIADVELSQAEDHLRRAKNKKDNKTKLELAADKFESAAKINFRAYKHEDEEKLFGKNKKRMLDSLKAAISGYLFASMCYRALEDDDAVIECMARAGKVFYEYYVDAVELSSVGESLADGKEHRIREGSAFSPEKGRRLKDGVETLRQLPKEEKKFMEFCKGNKKSSWDMVCDYDIDVDESTEYGGGMVYERVTVTVRRRGGWPPSWI